MHIVNNVDWAFRLGLDLITNALNLLISRFIYIYTKYPEYSDIMNRNAHTLLSRVSLCVYAWATPTKRMTRRRGRTGEMDASWRDMRTYSHSHTYSVSLCRTLGQTGWSFRVCSRTHIHARVCFLSEMLFLSIVIQDDTECLKYFLLAA